MRKRAGDPLISAADDCGASKVEKKAVRCGFFTADHHTEHKQRVCFGPVAVWDVFHGGLQQAAVFSICHITNSEAPSLPARVVQNNLSVVLCRPKGVSGVF